MKRVADNIFAKSVDEAIKDYREKETVSAIPRPRA